MGSRRGRTYHANLVTIWDHWVVHVPEACGVHAMVLRITEAEDVARDAIATVLEVDPQSFTVVVHTA